MQTLQFNIPVSKVPALATAAILDGSDLGSWLADSVDRSHLTAKKSTEAPAAAVAQAEEEESPTAPDFFADII